MNAPRAEATETSESGVVKRAKQIFLLISLLDKFKHDRCAVGRRRITLDTTNGGIRHVAHWTRSQLRPISWII